MREVTTSRKRGFCLHPIDRSSICRLEGSEAEVLSVVRQFVVDDFVFII